MSLICHLITEAYIFVLPLYIVPAGDCLVSWPYPDDCYGGCPIQWTVGELAHYCSEGLPYPDDCSGGWYIGLYRRLALS
jgi:hypothetical protein